MAQCAKCGQPIEVDAEECAHCGVVIAKLHQATRRRRPWQADKGGEIFSADEETLRGWIAEGRLRMEDKVRPPGGNWTAVSDLPQLLILITTGDLHLSYEPIDSIFAVDQHTGGFFTGSADPNKAFDGVKQRLRRICHLRGGDAVVNCQFEYRVAVAPALIGTSQVFELFAYGTAVRIKKKIPESL